jgi:hypothetical protein
VKLRGMASIDTSSALPRIAARISAPAAGLPLLFFIGAVFLGALGLLASVPNTFADEAIYIELARHLDLSGKSEILGIPFPTLTYGPAYVALIAPIAKGAATAREAYILIRGLNAAMFASATVPTFLIARRAVSHRAAILVAGAAIAIPASAYTAKIMTESLAYPVVLWSVLAGLLVLERPTVLRQAGLVLCIFVATAVRFELLVLAPAFALACTIGEGGRLKTRCSRLMPLLVGTGVLFAGAAAAMHAGSRSSSAAGAHGLDIHGFSVVRFGSLLVGSVGGIDLYSGVLPFASFLLIALAILRRAQWVRSDVRGIVLLTAILGGALLVTSSAYLATVPAAARPPIPPDRYTFYIVPLLFVVFAAWIEAGAKREAGLGWVAAAAAALPVLAALVAVAKHPHGTENGFAFLPWIGISGGREMFLLPILASYGGVCAFLLTRRKTGAHELAQPVLAVVTVTSVCAFFFSFVAPAYSPHPGWLDANSQPGVIAVWTTEPPPARSQGLWEIAVANRNLSSVYFTKTPDSFGQGVETQAYERRDGTLVAEGKPLRARYVLTPVETKLVGTVVAKRSGFAIYKTGGGRVQVDHSKHPG